MQNNRLESVLRTLAQQHTAQLVTPSDNFNDRVGQVAHRLAREGILVLVGDLHPNYRTDRSQHLQAWINAYAELYYLLTIGVFGITDEPTAYTVDNNYPMIAVFKGDTLVVVRVLSGLIIPYVALRQADGTASRAEIRGVLDMALEELEATDLPREQYQQIRARGIDLLDTLLKSKIRQVSLIGFSKDFLIGVGETKTAIQNTPRPDSLPELPTQRPNPGTLANEQPPRNILTIPIPAGSKIHPPIPPPKMLDRLHRDQ